MGYIDYGHSVSAGLEEVRLHNQTPVHRSIATVKNRLIIRYDMYVDQLRRVRVVKLLLGLLDQNGNNNNTGSLEVDRQAGSKQKQRHHHHR